MRTERKVDAIVFDWLREGLEERLVELLRALEQLSEGENVTEHVFDATQALQTLDRVFSMVDIQLVRVLVRTQLAALEPLENDGDERAISAQIESAALLQALLDRMAAGAPINPASLLPMVNRLRSTLKQPPLTARELAARSFLLQAEHELGKRPHHNDGMDDEHRLRPLLRQMEREVLSVMRDDWSVLPGLRDLSMQIIANEPSRSAIIAIRVFGDLLRLTESDAERYSPVLKRAVGRVLQLFRLQLAGRSEVVINHAGLDLGASVLLSLLDLVDDDTAIGEDSAAEWRALLSQADGVAHFVGLDAEALHAVARALEEELLATQDVLDLFVRGNREDLEPLGRILTKFEQMAGVLRTLGYAAAADALDASRERLLAVTRGAELLDDTLLMDLAGTVMLIEQVIQGIPESMAGLDRSDRLTDQTVSRSIGAIAKAAYDSLGEAREKINAGLAGQSTQEPSQGDHPFAQAADMLAGITEVLRLSGRDAATPLVGALARWARAQEFGAPVGDEHTLAALSEIFAALEFYLENLRDFQKEIARFLDGPKQRIDDLLGNIGGEDAELAGGPAEAPEPATAEADRAVDESEAAPTGSVDESLPSADELISFWQVEQGEATEPGAEEVPTEGADAAAGEQLSEALDFALDEGDREQRSEPAPSDGESSHDLPDDAETIPELPTGPAEESPAESSQAAAEVAELESLWLPEGALEEPETNEPDAAGPAGATPDLTELPQEAEESEPSATDSPIDLDRGLEFEPSEAPAAEAPTVEADLNEPPSSLEEDADAESATTGADASAGSSAPDELALAEAEETEPAALDAALDFSVADDQAEQREEAFAGLEEGMPAEEDRRTDVDSMSTELPGQKAVAPEIPEAGVETDESEAPAPWADEAQAEIEPAVGAESEVTQTADKGATSSIEPDRLETPSESEEPSETGQPEAGMADQGDALVSGEGTGDARLDLPEAEAAEPAPELPHAEGEAVDETAAATVDEDPMMQEMREVFAEEMGETVPDMATAAEAWQRSRDADALTTLRRGFHTIKGSGRMVGLDQIGEWAWAWENLLNRVIDGKREDLDVTRGGAVDAVELMQSALPDLESGRAIPDAHWESSKALAERLEAGETPESAATETPGETSVPFETDDEATASASDAVETTQIGSAQPVIDDPVLREIFDQEIGGYIDELHHKIDQAREHGVGLTCDNDLVRLLHTTLGSARTAGVDIIASLARYLEDWTRVLAEHNERLGGTDLKLFAEGADAIEALRRWAVDASQDRPDSGDIESRLSERLDEALEEYGEVAESAEARDSRQATSEQEQSAVDQAEREPEADESPLESTSEHSRDEAGNESGDAVGAETETELGVPSEAPFAEEHDEEASEDASRSSEEAADEYAEIERRPDDHPSEQDEDILQIFLDEADELLEQADAYLAHWRVHPHDLESIRLLHRNLHTLKGGARMAGLLNLGDVAHHLEGRLDLARREDSQDNEALVALVQHSYDIIAGLLDRVRNQQPIPQQRELIGLIRDPDGAERFAERSQAAPVEESAPVQAPSSAEATEAVSDTQPEAAPAEREESTERRDEQVRVAAGSIDGLVNQIGESVLLQSRIDRQVNGFERQLFELQQTVTRLRSQLRRLEIETETQIKADLIEEAGISEEQFDPLEFDRFTQVQELSRGIMESLGDVANIEESLSSLTEESQLLLLQQSRLGRKMQDGVLAMRLVRFNDVAGRLRRIVRQVGDEMGRQAELVIHNGDAEVDRVTLMALLPSLEHMLRNSLAHGIESPEERRAAKKNPVGQLDLTVDSNGGNITITQRDDGRGMDLDAIRRKAVERNLIPADIDISDEEARSLIFLPGFSTAGNLSQVAGRGVGMDVVASATRELGGFVDVDSEQGKYTEIRLNLPLTQAMTRGILIGSGDDRYAIPYKGVVAVTRMTGVALADHYQEEKPQIEYEGEQFPLYYLGDLLWGHAPAETAQDVAAIRPIMLFKLGERRFALHVDHQLGGIQLFVKSLGPQLGRIPGLSGATIADDGDVILVLELFELVQQFQRRDYQSRLGDEVVAKPQRDRPTVLVVDDSLTVRKVTARTLERNNYDVVLARDGVEALGVLQDTLPDLVLTDIEMPRMDGFELLGAIRNDRSSKDTPVIMISSRTGQKHRNRAEALGVSAYLGKPYTELDLIESIEQLLPRHTTLPGETSSSVVRPASGVDQNAD
ncbi:Hpt domain-containing protein [Guyparkeria sp. 1SP6A2]|nr:Hpt domain-containing protein [Guyparkeria sp. 1SP6A2]